MPALALKPSTIVAFPGGQRVRLDSPKAVSLVQQEIFASGLYYNKLADMAGISAAPVHHIAIGETKRPSFNTIFAILQALGWSIYAEKD
jgi:hypothetical protein